jgi:two-component system nitrate/nitrite response regulator NarL
VPLEKQVRAINTPATSLPVRDAAAQHVPTVLLADDDVVSCHGMRLVLEAAGLTFLTEVADSDGVIEAVLREKPDICMVNLRLPGGGLAAAGWICANAPETAVVLIAEEVTDDELFDALRLGVAGFVLKSMNPERLPHVLRGVLRGEAALPRDLAGRLAQEFRARGSRRYVALPDTRGVELTSREWEVLELLRSGESTREVAERLGIAQVTVRRHIGEILRKLQVDSRAAALELLERRSGT